MEGKEVTSRVWDFTWEQRVKGYGNNKYGTVELWKYAIITMIIAVRQ